MYTNAVTLLINKIKEKNMEYLSKVKSIPNDILFEMSKEEITKLAESSKVLNISNPPKHTDSDIILGELLRRFRDKIIEVN